MQAGNAYFCLVSASYQFLATWGCVPLRNEELHKGFLNPSATLILRNSIMIRFLEALWVSFPIAQAQLTSSLVTKGFSGTTFNQCGGCTLNLGNSTLAAQGISGSDTSPPTVIALLTEYQITSAFPSGGVCITISGSQIDLSPYLSITRLASADAAEFSSSALAHFQSYLGFDICAPGISPQVTLASATFFSFKSSSTLKSITGSTPLPTTSTPSPILPPQPSPSKTGSTGIGTTGKISVGIFIPVGSICVLVLSIILTRRYRKRTDPVNGGNNREEPREDSDPGAQPFLQQKAELDDEETRRRELEARARRFELNDDNAVHELQGPEGRPEIPHESTRVVLPSLSSRHELVGEESARELEGH